jgi:CheY-like chemotaxis protein
MSHNNYNLSKGKSYQKRKTFNILIADDDYDVANNLKIILELRGHHVTVVDDGLRCIAHCRDETKHYDLVFIDYHMEGLNGAKVTEFIKTKGNNTLIFAYTGDSSKRALDNFKQVGMNGAIIKPVDFSSFELLMSKIESSNVLDTSLITRKSFYSILLFD